MADKKTFCRALKHYLLSQFVYTDGLACRMCYAAIQEERLDRLWTIDQELFAFSGARETREGNKRMGRQLVKVMTELYPKNPLLKKYNEKIKQKERHGHSALVFAMVLEGQKVDLETTLSCYVFATASSLTQNAVRGIPLGQTDGQRILRELEPFFQDLVKKVLKQSEECFGACAPGLEIAQMKHEDLSVRLFSS
ncbi:urease accessory protein UreF [Bacillus tuaregi]|uniref:urease accessory protein UreF n=1 Tax=Bacillus tuaregi TaxID=1816695 RepID=UPI000A6F61EE|nr:urease accessory protein UreF [Bacillus tuaregi]